MNRAAASLTALVAVTTFAARAKADPMEALLGGHEPQLSAADEQVVEALANNRPVGGQPAVAPVIGLDGTVHYLYGAQDPSLVCAPLRICDIELQPGEEVLYANIGDKERWSVEPTYGGSAPAQTPHIFVSPRDIGLLTSLVISTNRRTYHFRLTSHSEKFMAKVTFTYPDDLGNRITVMRAQHKRETERRDQETEREAIPETGEYLGDLTFDYKIEGRAAWKPVRAYHDSKKTIIQMPWSMLHTEAPTLMELRTEGEVFSDDELVMPNYRIEQPKNGPPRYVVDRVLDRAVMIAGVGSNQQRVVIRRLARAE